MTRSTLPCSNAAIGAFGGPSAFSPEELSAESSEGSSEAKSAKE